MLGRMRLPLLALALAALGSCSSPSGPPPPPPLPPPSPPAPLPAPPVPQPSPPQPVGACSNVELRDATCSGFTVMRAPGQTAEPGSAVYDVLVVVEGQGQSFPITLHLLVRDESAADLERYYTGHAPVPCSGTLVRPPCNPAASGVGMPTLPIPPYARAQFY